MINLRRIPIALLVAGIISCDSWYSPVEVTERRCGPETVFSFGSGDQPALSWAGDCLIEELFVFPSDTSSWFDLAEHLWRVSAPPPGMRPPIQLGASRPAPALASAPFVLDRTTSHRLLVCPSGRDPVGGIIPGCFEHVIPPEEALR